MKKFLLLVLFTTLACGGLWGEEPSEQKLILSDAGEIQPSGFSDSGLNTVIKVCYNFTEKQNGTIGTTFKTDGKQILYTVYHDYPYYQAPTHKQFAGKKQLILWDGYRNHIIASDPDFDFSPIWVDENRIIFEKQCADEGADYGEFYLCEYRNGEITVIDFTPYGSTVKAVYNDTIFYSERLFLDESNQLFQILWVKQGNHEPESILWIDSGESIFSFTVDETVFFQRLGEKIPRLYRWTGETLELAYTFPATFWVDACISGNYYYWVTMDLVIDDSEEEVDEYDFHRLDMDSMTNEFVSIQWTEDNFIYGIRNSVCSKERIAVNLLDSGVFASDVHGNNLQQIIDTNDYTPIGWKNDNLFLAKWNRSKNTDNSFREYSIWDGEQISPLDINNPPSKISFPKEITIRVDRSGLVPNIKTWDGKNWLCISCEFNDYFTRPNRRFSATTRNITDSEGNRSYTYRVSDRETGEVVIDIDTSRKTSSKEVIEETSTPPAKDKAE